MLRILHTSDWHLGHTLFHKDRRQEQASFLDWLLSTIVCQEVDALLVSGDIFDTVAPPNHAQALYFDFLRRLVHTPCRKAIILGGNHDSASHLHAPRDLLRHFNVHVIGAPDHDRPESDLILLRDRDGQPAGLVAGVPFLRERDVRRAAAGESWGDRTQAYLEGIAGHYDRLRQAGRQRIAELCGRSDGLPLIASGHLFAAGGAVADSERQVTVGTLGGVPVSCLGEGFDYLALGHLHRPQAVSGPCPIRYSGSPLALSFSEARFAKEVVLVSFDGGPSPQLTSLGVPVFQPLASVAGGWAEVEAFFAGLQADGPPLWVEVQLALDTWGPEVQERVLALAQGTPAEVLAVRNQRRLVARLGDGETGMEALATLTPEEVFRRRLAQDASLAEEDIQGLLPLYHEILQAAWQEMEGGSDAD